MPSINFNYQVILEIFQEVVFTTQQLIGMLIDDYNQLVKSIEEKYFRNEAESDEKIGKICNESSFIRKDKDYTRL